MRSALAAISASRVETLGEVVERRLQLAVAPRLADGRHLAAALAQKEGERLGIAQDGALRDRRPDVALAGEAVTLRADAVEGLVPERLAVALALLDPGVVLLGRDDVDPHQHRRVLDSTELGALAAEGAEPVREEGHAVDLAGDGVELAAERGDPPAMGDVRGHDLELDLAVVRDLHPVDRDRAVRVVELPVELVAFDPDRLGARCRRCVLDAGDLREDERRNCGEDQDRGDRPRDLEVRMADHLWPLDLARPAGAPVLEDEEQQRRLDDHEDRARDGEDQPVDRADPAFVGIARRDRRKPAVPGRGRRGHAECELYYAVYVDYGSE